MNLNDGWVMEGLLDFNLPGSGVTRLSLYVGADRNPSAEVTGTAPATPVALTGTMGPGGATFVGLTLPAPAGVTYTGASDFTLVSEPGSVDPVIFDNVAVTGV